MNPTREEVEEALKRAMMKDCFSDCSNGALHCGCGERALYFLAAEVRRLRAAADRMREALRRIEVEKTYDGHECRWCGCGKRGFHYNSCPRKIAHDALSALPPLQETKP